MPLSMIGPSHFSRTRTRSPPTSRKYPSSPRAATRFHARVLIGLVEQSAEGLRSVAKGYGTLECSITGPETLSDCILLSSTSYLATRPIDARLLPLAFTPLLSSCIVTIQFLKALEAGAPVKKWQHTLPQVIVYVWSWNRGDETPHDSFLGRKLAIPYCIDKGSCDDDLVKTWRDPNHDDANIPIFLHRLKPDCGASGIVGVERRYSGGH